MAGALQFLGEYIEEVWTYLSPRKHVPIYVDAKEGPNFNPWTRPIDDNHPPFSLPPPTCSRCHGKDVSSPKSSGKAPKTPPPALCSKCSRKLGSTSPRRSPRLASKISANASKGTQASNLKRSGLDRVCDSRIVKRWSKNSRKIKRSRGLVNPSEDCYQNSALQCLFHMPEFVSYLDSLHNVETTCPDQKRGECVVCALKALLEAYRSDQSGSLGQARCDLKAVMKRTIPKDDPMYEDIRTGRQSDPFPFITYLFDQLKTREAELDEDSVTLDDLCRMEAKEEWTCQTCGKVKTVDGVRAGSGMGSVGLSVNINDPAINSRLSIYLKTSEFSAERDCRCESAQCLDKLGPAGQGETREVTKYVTKAPEILVIQLKRFTFDAKYRPIRTGSSVCYAQYINLAPFTENGQPIFYELQGVISHQGPSISSGHYIASVRECDGKRFGTLNDGAPIEHKSGKPGGTFSEMEEPMSRGSVFDPFVLFYTRC